MKFQIVIIILQIFILPNCFAIPKDWKLSRDLNNVKVWSLKNNPDVTASLEKRKNHKAIDWNKVKKTDFFKVYESKKKKILSFVGISRWQASSYSWKKSKSSYQLEVKGTYIDASNIKVKFLELHFYTQKETIQILQTMPLRYRDGDKLSKNIINFIKSEVNLK
jgi:hypothetical protein